MGKEAEVFAKGDWVVHRQYGVGQIMGVEQKRISQQKKKFYRVKTEDSTFWLPVDEPINRRVDPLPSRKMIKQALKVLQMSAHAMSKDNRKRKKRIEEVKAEGSLVAAAKLLRDLAGLKSEKKLNMTERRAMERLTKRILELWSIRMDVDQEEAQQKMQQWIFGV